MFTDAWVCSTACQHSLMLDHVLVDSSPLFLSFSLSLFLSRALSLSHSRTQHLCTIIALAMLRFIARLSSLVLRASTFHIHLPPSPSHSPVVTELSANK